jgi:ABC-type dipeptide/oligopeptide/nickel transport system permease subunit
VVADAQTIEDLGVKPSSTSGVGYLFGRLRHHPLGMFGFVGVVLLLTMAVFAPWIGPHNPSSQDFTILSAPSLAHPFGTDSLGRDILSRVVYASRVELSVSLSAVFIGVALATVVGTVSGYFGGITDSTIQRVNDVWLAFPGLILLLIVSAVLGPSPRTLVIALVVGTIPGTSRIIRGAVLSEKNNAYIEAARVMGCSQLRIMFRHVLPQIVPLIIVIVSIAIPSIALLGAALSFLGLGVMPPTPSWGADLSGDARSYFETAPWMAIFPGLALSLTVLSFNLLGDAMRDILDPRLRGSAQ